MSEYEAGSKHGRVTKFSSWAENEKLHKNGKNAFKVFRKFKKQLKAEAYSGKATSLDHYPALPYTVDYPTESCWNLVDPSGTSPVVISESIQEKIKTKVLENYLEEVKAYKKQDEKIYELLVQQVCSLESMEVIKADPDWKKIDGKPIQDDWISLYNLMVKTHVIQIGGVTSEAKLVAASATRYELYNFKQWPATSSTQHFEDHEDLIMKCKMLGMTLNEQELSFLLINSMHDKASREKREFDIKMGTPLPNLLSTTYTYIRHAENMYRSIQTMNGNRDMRERENRALTTDVVIRNGSNNIQGKNTALNNGRNKKRFTKPKYTLEERRAYNAKRAETQSDHKSQGKTSGKKPDAAIVTTLTERRTCYKCNKVGHIARNCRSDIDTSKDKVILVAEEDYEDIDRYDNNAHEHETAYVTMINNRIDRSDDDDETETESHVNYLYFKPEPIAIEPIGRTVTEEWGREACLLITDDNESVLTIESNVSRDSKEIRDLLSDRRAAEALKFANKMPTIDEVKQQLDLYNQRALFEATSGGLDLVLCNGQLVMKGGAYDVRNTPRDKIIKDWQDFYLNDSRITTNDNSPEDKGANMAKELVKTQQQYNHGTTETTQHPKPTDINYYKVPPMFSGREPKEMFGNHKTGIKCVLPDGRLSEFNYPPYSGPTYDTLGREVKPQEPVGSDRESYLSQSTFDSLHLFVYNPENDTQVSVSKGSDSDYSESLPEGFVVGERRSPRITRTGHPTTQTISNFSGNNVCLATGLGDWKESRDELEDRLRQEITREMKAKEDGKAGSPDKAAKELEWSHSQKVAWDITTSVRDLELERSPATSMETVKRKHHRHKNNIVQSGVMYYINKLFMKTLLTMEVGIQQEMRDIISESFDIEIDEKNPRIWRVVSDNVKMNDSEREEVGLLTMTELESDMAHTALMTTKREEGDMILLSDSESPESDKNNTQAPTLVGFRSDFRPPRSSSSSKRTPQTLKHKENIGSYLVKARVELLTKMWESQLEPAKEVGSYPMFDTELVDEYYKIIRAMPTWSNHTDYTCVFIIAAMEYDEFQVAEDERPASVRDRIRRWYKETAVVGDKRKYAVDLNEVNNATLQSFKCKDENRVDRKLFSPTIIDLTGSDDSNEEANARDSEYQESRSPNKKTKVENERDVNLYTTRVEIGNDPGTAYNTIRQITSHRRGVAELAIEDASRFFTHFDDRQWDNSMFDTPPTNTRQVGVIDIKILEGMKQSLVDEMRLSEYTLGDEDLFSLMSNISFDVGDYTPENRTLLVRDLPGFEHDDHHYDNTSLEEGENIEDYLQSEERVNRLDVELEEMYVCYSSDEEESKASDYEATIYSKDMTFHKCFVTSELTNYRTQVGGEAESPNNNEVSSDSSEVSEEDTDTQLDMLTFPDGYMNLERRATSQYQLSMRNERFMYYRTQIVERDQYLNAVVRARSMRNLPNVTNQTIDDFMNQFSSEQVASRRNGMMTADILPNTTFVGMRESHLFYVIEDDLGDYSYMVRSFETEQQQLDYLNNVNRRHASAFPVSNEQGNNDRIHNNNTNIIILSSAEYSNILKESYLMSEHHSNDTPSHSKNDAGWWNGDADKGIKHWSVMDWVSVCSSLAHVLPIMAMNMLFGGDSVHLDKNGTRNTSYRKCIQFMIWCFNVGNNINNFEEEIRESVLLTLDTPMYVILDSGSTAHMVRDIGLLSNVKKMSKPVSIGGVEHEGKGIVCKLWGDLMGVKQVMYSDKSSANILSLSALKDKGHSVVFDNDKDMFIVKFKGNDKTYHFARNNNDKSKSRHYGCKLDRHNSESICVRTVKDNLKQYNIAEIEKAKAAREQGNMLGFITTDAHCNLIKSGELKNNTVTVADVYRALKIWGPSIPAMMGKTKLSAAPKASMESLPPAVHESQILEIDVFFVQEIPFLIGVLNPMSYCMSSELKNRSVTQIRGVLMSMISACRSNNIDITAIRSDNERGLIALKDDIQIAGIKLELAPPGGHVPLPERKICQLKSIVRATKASVPWEMPRVVVVFCVLFATGCINYQRVTAKPYVISPHQQFTGEVIDASLHLKAPFGAYAQATVATTDNSMNPRTHSAIVLGIILQYTLVYIRKL